MRRLLLSTVFAAAIPFAAHAAELAVYCGPSSGAACEDGGELKVFLQKASDVTVGFGNIGSQNGLPIMTLTSDGGSFNQFIDLANGFATVTAANPAKVFNGLDITVPGYTFTKLVFDVQLTGQGSSTEGFTATGFTGSHVTVLPVGNESGHANQDAEYSITATGGTFDEVNLLSLTGFDEIKHIEIEGLDPITTAMPEPASLALLGLGLLGLGLVRGSRRA